jgi:hypothetical protein
MTSSSLPTRRLIYDQPDRVSQWVYSRLPYSDDATAFCAIGLEHAGELVAGVVYNSYTGFDIDMSAATVPHLLWRPHWLVPIFRYPFAQLRCRRVSAGAASRNRASIAVLLHLGFKPEGCKRNALPDDDLLLFGMKREECRYLENMN